MGCQRELLLQLLPSTKVHIHICRYPVIYTLIGWASAVNKWLLSKFLKLQVLHKMHYIVSFISSGKAFHEVCVYGNFWPLICEVGHWCWMRKPGLHPKGVLSGWHHVKPMLCAQWCRIRNGPSPNCSKKVWSIKLSKMYYEFLSLELRGWAQFLKNKVAWMCQTQLTGMLPWLYFLMGTWWALTQLFNSQHDFSSFTPLGWPFLLPCVS